MANRKRTSLDALISPAEADTPRRATGPAEGRSGKARAAKKAAVQDAAETREAKSEIVRQTLYLPLPVFDQLRDLFFEEQRGQVKRRRMHDYFLEGIDLLFKDRGLKSIEELTGRK
jgi:hypothetical protein